MPVVCNVRRHSEEGESAQNLEGGQLLLPIGEEEGGKIERGGKIGGGEKEGLEFVA